MGFDICVRVLLSLFLSETRVRVCMYSIFEQYKIQSSVVKCCMQLYMDGNIINSIQMAAQSVGVTIFVFNRTVVHSVLYSIQTESQYHASLTSPYSVFKDTIQAMRMSSYNNSRNNGNSSCSGSSGSSKESDFDIRNNIDPSLF